MQALSAGIPAALLAVTVALSAEMVTTNVLDNPGFEDPDPPDVSGSDQALGWIRWGQWMNRMTSEPGWATRSGDGMLVYQHWRADSPESGWYQDVSNLVPDCWYRFSLWTWRDPNCNAGVVELVIAPVEGGTPYRVERFGPRDIGPRWTVAAVHAKLPANATAARFSVRCRHGFTGDTGRAEGAIRFDDADVHMLAVRGR